MNTTHARPSPSPPNTHTQGRLAHGHQPRRMGSEVWEAKPEFKIGIRSEVTGWKLLRRTKHAHPSLLMASLGRRPRWPRGCRHISSLLSSSPNQNNPLHSFLFKPSHSSPCPFLLQAALPKPASNFFLKNETPARLFSHQKSQLPPIFGNKKQTVASTISSAHKQSLPRRFHSPTLVLREKENRTRVSLKP